MDDAKNLWLSVKKTLKSTTNIGSSEFKELFEPITEIHKIQNNYIFIIVPHQLTKFRIERFYLNTMNKLLGELVEEKTCFKLITADDAKKENEENQTKNINRADPVEPKKNSRMLRPEYTFENFVTGESNRYAFVTSSKVAESPSVTINPLYIFGDVGLGKTHLMSAIGWYILEKNINSNVVYTTAQQFTDEYFMATHKDSIDAIQDFNNRYRSADVLLVDDIQFLANKKGTQEEFFKLFEYLFENNKQIVLTSDRNACELENIMERLKSRFSWGMMVDVKKPDFNHRFLILKRKLEFLLSTPDVVEKQALEFIAEKFDKNVRELEGALRRFVNYCVSFNIPYTLENAKISLESIIVNDKPIDNADNFDCIEAVKRSVSKYYNVSVVDLASETRKKEVILPRQIAIYIIRNKFNIPLKKIGEYFGNRDHATIAHSIDKITNALDTDWTIKQDIDNIIKGLK